ncbi:MAG: biosynthetic-type acetolactate synthase large subunit [Candidatus Schekmanbacteria bacterium]|nr:MAG: biosynthetic-type acetolactate synthase large subunit [Candidatus Schekmanbacteria bacterium]
MKKGSEIIVECLERENVKHIFGLPGAVLCDVYDVLHDSPIDFIICRHEQAAAHAADGYARVSGKTGVCMVTSGPGATNIVTGLATAYMDSIPMVAFTGQVPTTMIGDDAFQEADIAGITRTITKHNYLVNDIKDLARIIREAFYIASTGRPGPVLVDLPKDIIHSKTKFEYPEKVSIRGYNPNLKGHPKQIEKIAVKLSEAKRPVIYMGGGVILSNASREVEELAHMLNIPVTSTLMGLGGFPSNDKLFLGMLGMHGTYWANMATNNSDLIIALGARFDDRVTGRIDKFAPDATVVHIDIDPSAISKNITVDIPVVGDVKEVLKHLNEEVKKRIKSKPKRTEWFKEIEKWKAKHPLLYGDGKKGYLKPQWVIEKISELADDSAIITTDVGQHQMWTAQYFKFKKPRTWLTSGGLGTMGYGLPAAIGAKMANPKSIVVNISGDGSFQMNCQEIATAKTYGVPFISIVLNNNSYGMVRQYQTIFYKKRYYATDLDFNPDFVKLAESLGAEGYYVDDEKKFIDIFKKSLKSKLPVVIEVKIEKDEKVFPMVPAGGSVKDILVD